jgi:hypothetical protein
MNMHTALTAEEKANVDALIALAMDQWVPDEDEDHYDERKNRSWWITRALLRMGEVEWAMQYLDTAEEDYDADFAYLLSTAYVKAGQPQLAIHWEQRCYEMLKQMPDDHSGFFNYVKQASLCALGKLAFDRGDLVQMEHYFQELILNRNYHDIAGLSMLQLLVQCGSYDRARFLIQHLAPLGLSLSSTFAGLPVVKTLFEHGLELEFWAMAGMYQMKSEHDSNSLLYKGIQFAVDLDNIPLALRILSVEQYDAMILMQQFCDALKKNGREEVLKSLLMDERSSHRLSPNCRLLALATYARVGWKTDKNFILEGVDILFRDSERLDKNARSLFALIFAWLNYWDGPMSIQSLSDIPEFRWAELIEPSIVHDNQTLYDKLFEIAGVKDRWRCFLLLELKKSQLGRPNILESGFRQMLEGMDVAEQTWTWEALSPLWDFVSRTWRNLEAEVAFMDFLKEKSLRKSGSVRNRHYTHHARGLASAGRILDAIECIPRINTGYERLEAISGCIENYLKFKQSSNN